MSESTDADSPEVEALRRRVKELEDTVLYLSNTLMVNGLINQTEAMVARRMHSQGRQLEDEL